MKKAKLQGPRTNQWLPGVGARRWRDSKRATRGNFGGLMELSTIIVVVGRSTGHVSEIVQLSNKTVNFTVFKLKAN